MAQQDSANGVKRLDDGAAIAAALAVARASVTAMDQAGFDAVEATDDVTGETDRDAYDEAVDQFMAAARELRTAIGVLLERGTFIPTGDPVRPVLDLSTHHLPRAIGPTGLTGEEGVTAYPLPHGYLMWVPTDPEATAADYPTLPGVVLAVMRYARARGCDYVLFDQEGAVVADLPTWEW
jgi:hypothetical protein